MELKAFTSRAPAHVPSAAALVDTMDWSQTSLGPRSEWSATLRTLVDLVLACKSPMRLLWGQQMNMVYNDSYAQILAERHPAAMGQPCEKVWKEAWSVIAPRLQRAMAGEAVAVRGAEFVLHRNGQPASAWFDYALTPVREGERVLGVLTVATETTEGVRADERLRASEANLRAMAEAMPHVLWSADTEGVITYMNSRWDELTGKPYERGMWSALLHPDDSERVLSAWRACIAGGKAMDLSFRMRRRDGEYRWCLARAAPLLDDSGNVVKWWGTNTDVHEQRTALEALEDARRRLQATLIAADVGTWVMDIRKNQVVADANMVALHGITPEVGAGGPAEAYFATLHPDDVDAVQAQVAHCFATLAPYDATFRVRRDGAWRWLRAQGKVTADSQGPAWLYGIVQDVTAQVESEEKLRLMDRRKDEFLAMLAHELRNPLAPITSAAGLLQKVPGPPEHVVQMAALVERQARHMSGLVEDLLDVSRVTRGLTTLDRNRVDLAQVVREAMEQVQPQAASKSHALDVTLPTEPVWVEGDAKRLVQVAVNLVQNAVKYTPASGHIRVQLQAQDGHARLSVQDNGIGMSPALLQSAFELFVQGERSADRAQGGLGVGLALVKSLVDLHGGAISAHSEGTGKGCLFEVVLPTVPAGDAAAPEGELVVRPEGAGKRVLVVDDNQDARELLALLLREYGFDTHQGATARQALALASQQPFDACLLDVGLPDMNGLELAAQLRQLPGMQGARIATLTGYGQPADRKASSEAGCDAHFSKPAATEDLVAWLRAA